MCEKTKKNKKSKKKLWFLKVSVFIIWVVCGECECNMTKAPSDMEIIKRSTDEVKWGLLSAVCY